MQTNSFIRWCRRYCKWPFFAVVGMIVFLTFFNDNSLMKYYEYNSEIERLEIEIEQYRDTFLYYQTLNRRLATDPATLERVVREQYHMQRTNEDVYVFEK